MSGSMLRLLIVEDHPIFREGLQAALLAFPDLLVVAAVATVAEAQTALDEHHPDVALVDLALPDGSGLDVTQRAAANGTVAIVLTMSRQPDVLLEAVRAGARGYLVKGAGREEIVSAVRAAARGEAIFGSDVADHVLSALTRQDPAAAAFPTLSQRERDVLRLLAHGLPNRSIATRLHLSEKTVRNHVSGILAKLDVSTRHDAADLARAAHLQ
jgi:DNA-binding NarL/FixJ family response regulator